MSIITRRTGRERRSRRGGGRLGALLLLAVGVLMGGGWAGAAAATTGPQAVIGQTTVDFGKIYEDQPLTHTFVIQNRGTETLRIEDVDPDCACTVARYDKTIPPGSQGEITLTIKPFSVVHRFKKETTVRLNDPNKPVLYLDMIGVAQPYIEIQPHHIVRLRGGPGDNLQGEVHFISHLSQPWKITSFTTNIPDKIEVSLKPEEPGKKYLLVVRNKSQKAGRYAGMIRLATTSKKRPYLIVRVFGDIYLASSAGQ